mmetsp:Transcript_30976/g.73855  ORF Transcript_30976/g.73855 Transcript_30976/m.73855 type:complete len:199 (-) Transcript_30976:143-739(-)
MFHRIALLILYLSTRGGVLSFSATPPRRSSGDGSALKAESIDRRSLMTSAAAALIAVGPALSLVSGAPGVANAVETKDALISDLKASLDKIQTVPGLVEAAEWDKVRTILKTPPVNQLWNLGESQNTLVKLAKETGDFEIMEIKDELAVSLQMTDQYSYDNVFIYYQPGNGKVKTKEPLQMANQAIGQLKEALSVVEQ